MSQGRYRLRTFGVLRLEQDGQVIGRFLPTRISDRVLAIVVAGGGTVPISDVIEQVWGSEIHRDPRLLLNENLYQLRRRLAEWGLSAPEAKIFLRSAQQQLVINPDVVVDLDPWRTVVSEAGRGSSWLVQADLDWARRRLDDGFLAGFVDAPVVDRRRALEEELTAVAQVFRAQGGAPATTVVRPAELLEDIGHSSGDDPAISEDVSDIPAIAQGRAARYLDRIARSVEPEITGPQRDLVLTLLDGYSDRLTAALSWALSKGNRRVAVGLCANLWPWWCERRHPDAVKWIQQALALSGRGRASDEALILHGLGCLCVANGDLAVGERNLRAAMTAWQALGDDSRLARSIGALAMMYYRDGDYSEALRLAREASAIHRAVGNDELLAFSLNDRAVIELALGDRYAAMRCLDEAIRLAERTRLLRVAATAHELAATIALGENDTRAASRHYERAISDNAILGDSRHLASTLLGRGSIAHMEHEQGARGNEALDVAEALYLRAEQVSRESNDPVGIGQALRCRAHVAIDRGDPALARSHAETALALLEAGNHSHATDALRELLEQLD